MNPEPPPSKPHHQPGKADVIDLHPSAVALGALEAAGLAGPLAPPEWQQAFSNGQHSVITLNTKSGGTNLLFWPATGEGKRIAALFSASGALMGAAILARWPEVRKPEDIAELFRRSGQQQCQASGLTVDLTGAAITVEEEMHWKSCRQSAAPWWPFYVLEVTPRTGKKFKLYVDLAGGVHRTLKRQTKAGG